ncbi:hypothetical protein HU200_019716 [Digitaria exilis]|uniref:TFIIS N-terminal domain-containing protein n=1 Tax=Digitaria exilis TaxID=1010633 RepID=A0A835KDZ4_9POAL|nr:hypothetical protein HU200_019716 [Digitaria exilis]
MGSDGRLRRALAAFGGGGDVWDLVDAALAAVARDSPDELRARRDGIIERLYAGGRCRNCDSPPSPAQPRKTNETVASVAAPAAAFPASPDEEVDVDGLGEDEADAGVESKILAIRDFLEDPDQETDIGRHVNALRKHPSGEVRQLVKLLVRKWKEIVDDWVRLHNSAGDGGSSIISMAPFTVALCLATKLLDSFAFAGNFIFDSWWQVMVTHLIKSNPNTIKILRLQTSNGFSSERSVNHNLVDSTMEKRRTSPAPAYHNTKQNSNSNYSTASSSVPARIMREQKDTLLDSEKLDSARKRLQENYQEAQNGNVSTYIHASNTRILSTTIRSDIYTHVLNFFCTLRVYILFSAKKQRTIQVMDIHDIPKPKNRNTFIRKSGGGLPARHR